MDVAIHRSLADYGSRTVSRIPMYITQPRNSLCSHFTGTGGHHHLSIFPHTGVVGRLIDMTVIVPYVLEEPIRTLCNTVVHGLRNRLGQEVLPFFVD